jgi:hypothetical protein
MFWFMRAHYALSICEEIEPCGVPPSTWLDKQACQATTITLECTPEYWRKTLYFVV